MKMFFDSEFTGLHQNTTLVSIGLIADSGETFYAEFVDYDKSQVDDWIQENVIDKLRFKVPEILMPTPLPDDEDISDYPDGAEQYYYIRTKNREEGTYNVEMQGTTALIKNELTDWIEHFNREMEIWSDCLSYDWVLFCQIWGHAFAVPAPVYYIPFDICTLFRDKIIDPDIHRETFAKMDDVNGEKHNALWDARVIRECYNILTA